MATVRDTDLPDLLISLGYQVKRIGRYYTCLLYTSDAADE